MTTTPPPFDAASCEELAQRLADGCVYVDDLPDAAAQLRAACEMAKDYALEKSERERTWETKKVALQQLDEARAECERLRAELAKARDVIRVARRMRPGFDTTGWMDDMRNAVWAYDVAKEQP